MAATITGCVIRVDDPDHALRPCGDRPLLAWWLRELCRFGVEHVRILGREPAGIDLAAFLPRPMTISWTTPGQERPYEGRHLYCDGIAWVGANLARLLSESAADGDTVAERTLLLHHAARAVDSGVRVINPGARSPSVKRQTVSDGAILADTDLPTRLRRSALFLDRDGVLNVDHGFVGSRDRFEWVEGATEAIRHATDAGWHVFIVTNQSGVARGYFDEQAVADLLRWIVDEVRAAGGTIDDTRHCPYHPQAAIEAYRQPHPWRKPQPGMLLDLIRAWDLDPRTAVMIGDQQTDVQAAAAAGVCGHLFPGGNLLSFLRPLLDPSDSFPTTQQ